MSDLYEYYNTGDDGAETARGVYWKAQTFTPATAHKITSVKLLLYRIGSPGTLTVGIRATDGSGHPTGSDLCSGTTDGDTLPTGSPYEWREIILGDGYDLEADTKYAIVARALDGTVGNQVQWREDASSPTYAGGCMEYSGDSGSSWDSLETRDFMFEDWGEPSIITHEWEGSDGVVVTDALVKNPIKTLSDGVTLADALVKNPIKALTDTIGLTDVVEKLYIHVRTFTDGIVLADTLVRTFARTFIDNIKIGDVLKKVWTHGVLRVLNAIRNLPSIREDPTKR